MTAFLFLVASWPPTITSARSSCGSLRVLTLWASRGAGRVLIGATRQTDGRPEGSHSDEGAANCGTPPASTTTQARDTTWGPDRACRLLHVAEGHGRRWPQ